MISKHKQNFKQRRKCLEEINFKSLGRPLPFKRKGKEILLIDETPKFSREIENTLQTNNFLALADSEIDSNFILKELIPIKALATTNSSNLKLSNTLIHTNNICSLTCNDSNQSLPLANQFPKPPYNKEKIGLGLFIKQQRIKLWNKIQKILSFNLINLKKYLYPRNQSQS